MRTIILSMVMLLIFAGFGQAAMPKRGDQAPDFSLETLDGQNVSLGGLKGKVVLVGMFHICVPCMNQAMEFEKVRQAIKSDKLVILGINTSGDSKADVTEYLASFPQKVNFPYLLDPKMSVHGAYIQRDMPTVLIIGADGVILARTPGVDADQLIPFLEKLL